MLTPDFDTYGIDVKEERIGRYGKLKGHDWESADWYYSRRSADWRCSVLADGVGRNRLIKRLEQLGQYGLKVNRKEKIKGDWPAGAQQPTPIQVVLVNICFSFKIRDRILVG